MSFIANASPSTLPADRKEANPTVVENDGWFPDIALDALREAMRLDGTVTDARLVQAVVNAILYVNGELQEWQSRQTADGHKTMTDVPATHINRESRLCAQYRRAVYSTTKADLIERYRDYDTTASLLSDKKTMEWLNDAPGDQRRNAHWAIADIVGRPHLTVELI